MRRGTSIARSWKTDPVPAAGGDGHAHSDHPDSGGDRLGALPSPEPMVVDADRLELAIYRQHDHHHLLDHRLRLHRRCPVHGLLHLAVSPPAWTAGDLRAREPEAGMVA